MSEAPFKPHAIIITERSVPQPIWVAGIIGVAKLKRINLDDSRGQITFLRQTLEGVKAKLERWNSNGNDTGQLPAFGKPTGVIINFAPDYSEHYDLDGTLIKTSHKAVKIGYVSTRLG